jgi:hypothetical protein
MKNPVVFVANPADKTQTNNPVVNFSPALSVRDPREDIRRNPTGMMTQDLMIHLGFQYRYGPLETVAGGPSFIIRKKHLVTSGSNLGENLILTLVAFHAYGEAFCGYLQALAGSTYPRVNQLESPRY